MNVYELNRSPLLKIKNFIRKYHKEHPRILAIAKKSSSHRLEARKSWFAYIGSVHARTELINRPGIDGNVSTPRKLSGKARVTVGFPWPFSALVVPENSRGGLPSMGF